MSAPQDNSGYGWWLSTFVLLFLVSLYTIKLDEEIDQKQRDTDDEHDKIRRALECHRQGLGPIHGCFIVEGVGHLLPDAYTYEPPQDPETRETGRTQP